MPAMGWEQILFYAGVALLGIMVVWNVLLLRRLSRGKWALERAKLETEQIFKIPYHTPYPLLQVDAQGEVLYANPAAAEVFRLGNTKGFQCAALKDAHEIIGDLISGAETTCIRDIEIEGRAYTQMLQAVSSGGRRSVIIYSFDVSALVSAQKQAEVHRRAAEIANQAKGDFLANMSHELRTPMNGIIGLSGVLADTPLPGNAGDLAAAVNKSARDLLVLLNDILDFSKIEAGELKLEVIPFSLRMIIAHTLDIHRSVASAKGLLLQGGVFNDAPDMLCGDPVRIQQVINNFVSNAIKFTHDGSIIIRAAVRHGKAGQAILEIGVKDTGIGIPAHKQKAIFEKFTQADISTARKYGGTGLGLTITRNLIQMMNGVITLSSEEGKGSIFAVRIPITQASEEEILAMAAQQLQHQNCAGAIRKDIAVLVVDDHPVNLLYMRSILSGVGIQNFDEADNGGKAAELAQLRQYDIIFMDCQMPEMSGPEAAAIIRAQGAGSAPVIIALTADAMKGAAEKYKDAGMDDYLAKPIDRADVIRILARYAPGDQQERTEYIIDNHGTATGNQMMPEADGILVMNWRRVDEFTQGDENLRRQMIKIFLEQAQEDIGSLERGYAEGDHTLWASTVHRLYGATSNIGAEALSALCDEAQELGASANDNKARLHQAILGQYRELAEVLQG